jgi:DNA topoisomerase-1
MARKTDQIVSTKEASAAADALDAALTRGIPGKPAPAKAPRKPSTKSAAAPPKPAPKTSRAASPGGSPGGKHLVIVESPAKAKTINKYLGSDYIVRASVGHVRDLPKRNPKGVKNPVPGVDLNHRFEPTYEVIDGKGKTVAELRKLAKTAKDIWLATDLDREGEAIAWHVSEALGMETDRAKRVVFNAITKDEIRRAFESPRPLNMDKVNAQQARRILDRIVGYQVSPLLWKKVAGGLSAGRVQSVAVRIIVDREREIMAFTPEEYWKVTGYFTTDLLNAGKLRSEWAKWLQQGVDNRAAAKAAGDNRSSATGRTGRERNGWLSQHQSLSAELIEVGGKRFEPKNIEQAMKAAALAGFTLEEKQVVDDPKGKGPAAQRVTLVGKIGPDRDWAVRSIITKRTRSRPYPPFITSTLQQGAANFLGFSANSTMRTAQQLYEGIDIRGMGSVGLITYMRTDSTHLSAEAITMARGYIAKQYGDKYLPGAPNFYKSSNKAAQEAHEAIRPTDVTLSPDDPSVRGSLSDQQYKLYKLIWQRFLSCQMTPAEWDSTTVTFGTKVEATDIVFRTTGRMLVFDGFYRVVGVPAVSDELTLPKLAQGQKLAPLQVDPTQHFTAPPPRYSEASLVKKLEAEGIGRPSTYASIINVIQNRKYVDKQSSRFFATDMGMVVTDKLVEAFPHLLEIGYTRKMELELDRIETDHRDWVKMLEAFYGPFKAELANAYASMQHAKAATEPAPEQYKCPTCGSPTMYRFGRNGRFLSCSTYPACKYAAPVDRDGVPQAPEHTDVACPKCSAPMLLRKGRFGPFLSCSRYPDCDGIVKIDRKGFVSPPKAPPLITDLPCPKCAKPLALRSGKRGPWLSCSNYPKCRGRESWAKLPEADQKKWELALLNHEKQHPLIPIKTLDGKVIPDNYAPKIPRDPGSDEAPEETDDADAA